MVPAKREHYSLPLLSDLYPIPVGQLYLHDPWKAVHEGLDGQSHMSHRPAKVNLNTGMKQEMVTCLST